MKKLSLKICLVFTIAIIPFAMSYGQQERGKKRKEVKAYIQENILPKLSEARLALDGQLSERDKNELENLRSAVKVKKASDKEFMRQLRELRKDDTPLTDEQKIKWADIQLEKEKTHKAVRAIAERNEEAIKTQLEALKPFREVWQEDIAELMGKEFKQNERLKNRSHGRRKSRGRKGQNSFLGKIQRIANPVGFLLWDGTADYAHFEHSGVEAVMSYPNPSSTETNITFSIHEEGSVTVKILDNQGEILKTLFEGNKKAGEHTLTFSTETLDSGVYFYRISTAAGVNTKRFVVRK